MNTLIKLFVATSVAAAALGPARSRAEVLDLTIEPIGAFTYGDSPGVLAILRYRGEPCPASGALPPMQGTLALFRDNVRVVDGARFFLAFHRSCKDGIYTAGQRLGLGLASIGTHTVRAVYSGEPGLAATQSAPLEITVRPAYEGSVPGVSGSIGLGVPKQWGAMYCNLPGQRSIAFSATSPANQPPPPAGDYRYGFVNFQIACYWECGFLCPPLPPIRVELPMQLELPEPLPPGATIWAYTPSADNPSASWQALPTSIDGRLATVMVQGGYIGGAPVPDGVLRGTIGVAIPSGSDFAYKVQDMWWGGPGEDGWGASISQVGNRILMTLLVYDGEGKPAWYILRDSSWDSARQVFGGALYRPNARRMGSPVGSATLSFDDASRGTLSYELNGQRGTKAIQRLAFGPSTSQIGPHAGFWELTAAGTGAISINKRGESLFVSWLEFPEGGPGQWLVAPEGKWTDSDTFEAALYRTTSSAWAGADYDASQLRLQQVGTFKLRFTGNDNAEISYTVNGVSAASPVRRSFY